MRSFEEYIRLYLQERKRSAMLVLYKLILMMAMHLNFYNDWATIYYKTKVLYITKVLHIYIEVCFIACLMVIVNCV
jgi:hypothetical protein